MKKTYIISIFILSCLLIVVCTFGAKAEGSSCSLYKEDTSSSFIEQHELDEQGYAVQFKFAASFSSAEIFIAKATKDPSITVNIYQWKGNIKDTLSSEAVCGAEGIPVISGRWVNVSFDKDIAPGEYVMETVLASGSVSVKAYLPAGRYYRMYYSGYAVYGSLQCRINFNESVKTPLESISEDKYIAPVIPEKQEEQYKNINPGSWTVVDGLGRSAPTYESTGDTKKGKYVGMFYWTWQYEMASKYIPRNITQIMESDPDVLFDKDRLDVDYGGVGAYWWNEPLFGYYSRLDEYVLRKHAELLADALVDVIIFDCTNGSETWEKAYMKLCEVFEEARADGVDTPDIAFMLRLCQSDETNEAIAQIYRKMYSKGLYQDLWFYWEGKPLVLAYPETLDEELNIEHEILDFFTFKRCEPSYFTGDRDNSYWGWLSRYPQAKYLNEDGSVEQITVGIAQNGSDEVGLTCMSDQVGQVYGRSFTRNKDYSYSYTYKGENITVNKDIPNVTFYGLNFQEQWDYAIAADPEFVFVTGWNEWIMGCTKINGNACGFPDQFNDEYSRDIEPSAGKLKDYYYYQLVSNIRRFKGIDRPRFVAENAKKTIDIHGDMSAWDDIGAFYHYTDSTYDRDTAGWVGTKYVNYTMRNDFVSAKIAYDDSYVYIYVQTEDDISPYTDKAWMRVFIDTDPMDTKGSWEGYEYVINRESPSADKCFLERSSGDWNWVKVAEAEYSVKENVLQIAVPRESIGMDKSISDFNFKLSDNMQEDGNILDFYSNGDVAPGGRFMFHFSTKDHEKKSGSAIYVIYACAFIGIAAIVTFILLKKRSGKRTQTT